MERLQHRLSVAKKALSSFEELAKLETQTDIERDAAIQRFEFSFEAVWKAAKQFLYDVEGLDVASPKGVLRHCREIGLLTPEETVQALDMVNERNLTVHTYDENVARAIQSNLKRYYELLYELFYRMEKRNTM